MSLHRGAAGRHSNETLLVHGLALKGHVKYNRFPVPVCFVLLLIYLPATGINTSAIIRSEVDMTTRQSDVANNLPYTVRPPIYGFVIEKEFSATLFSAPCTLTANDRFSPFACGSICGDFNPWLTAFRFKDGPSRSSSSFGCRFETRSFEERDVITP